jgi:hypothetical protein
MITKRNPLQPHAALLCKLGSIVIHVDEMISTGGHEFDRVTLEGLLQDNEVKTWLAEMDKLSFLPKKR